MRLRIEKAVTDCLGLSHDESGRAVLIRGALPGEVVECTILDGAKGVLKAEAAEVLIAKASQVKTLAASMPHKICRPAPALGGRQIAAADE